MNRVWREIPMTSTDGTFTWGATGFELPDRDREVLVQTPTEYVVAELNKLSDLGAFEDDRGCFCNSQTGTKILTPLCWSELNGSEIIIIHQLSDGTYVCNGNRWLYLEEMKESQKEFHPNALYHMILSDKDTNAFWLRQEITNPRARRSKV